MDYEIQQVPEGTYAVIRRTVAFSDVPSVMPELMGKVQNWADTVPHGVHMCISSMTPDGQLNIAPGVEVKPGAVEPPEGLDLVTRPAQRAAVHLYVGPYEGLPGVYQEFHDQLQRDGYTEKGEPIEIYEKHDPVPETRIIWPLNESRSPLRAMSRSGSSRRSTGASLGPDSWSGSAEYALPLLAGWLALEWRERWIAQASARTLAQATQVSLVRWRLPDLLGHCVAHRGHTPEFRADRCPSTAGVMPAPRSRIRVGSWTSDWWTRSHSSPV